MDEYPKVLISIIVLALVSWVFLLTLHFCATDALTEDGEEFGNIFWASDT